MKNEKKDGAAQAAPLTSAQLKAIARRLEKLAEDGEIPEFGQQEIKHSRALEIAARLAGKRDWREVNAAEGARGLSSKARPPGPLQQLDGPFGGLNRKGEPQRLRWEGNISITAMPQQRHHAGAFCSAWTAAEALAGRSVIALLPLTLAHGARPELMGRFAERSGIKLQLCSPLESGQPWGAPSFEPGIEWSGMGNPDQALELAGCLLSNDSDDYSFQRNMRGVMLGTLLMAEATREQPSLSHVYKLVTRGPTGIIEALVSAERKNEEIGELDSALMEIRHEQLLQISMPLLDSLMPWRNPGGRATLSPSEALKPGRLTLICPTSDKRSQKLAEIWLASLMLELRRSEELPPISLLLGQDLQRGKESRLSDQAREACRSLERHEARLLQMIACEHQDQDFAEAVGPHMEAKLSTRPDWDEPRQEPKGSVLASGRRESEGKLPTPQQLEWLLGL